jgi:hypothetical protein
MAEEMNTPARRRVKIGDRYGRLVVQAKGDWRQATRQRFRLWACQCDCGNDTQVLPGKLSSGRTKSCGCLSSETTAQRNTIHGDARRGRITPEWRAWTKMKERCFDSNCEMFPFYGGRGITVCDRWIGGFENFLSDMGRKPSRLHSLDRIDGDGNYEPGNCRWATTTTQVRNRSNTRMVEFRGRVMPLGEACAIAGVPYNKARQRIARDGMTVEAALKP